MNKNNLRNWVVVFGYPWSDKRIYGGGNIILLYHREGKNILWINPIPNRNLNLFGSKIKSKVLAKRIWEKLKQQAKVFRKEKDRFYVISPFYIPIVENKYIYSINKLLVYLQVKLFQLIFRISQPIVCTMGTNDNVSLIKSLNYKVWFHNAGDLYHDLRGISQSTKKFLYNIELKIFNAADVIFVASYVMVEKVKKMLKNPNRVIYFPHGADFNHFSSNVKINNNISCISKPIVGYFGSLTEANDKNILIEIAKTGINLVLIGDLLGDYDECKKYPNIHFFNAVPYDILPSYAKHIDLGILAWKPAQWINNCNPKKTYEYLSLGIPIVSVNIPQLINELGEFISFADSPSQFVQKVYFELETDNSIKRQKRIERAKKASWEDKFEYLKSILNNYVRKN